MNRYSWASVGIAHGSVVVVEAPDNRLECSVAVSQDAKIYFCRSFHSLYLFYLFVILFIMPDGAKFTILPVHLAAKVEEVTAFAVATFHELVSPLNLNLY